MSDEFKELFNSLLDGVESDEISADYTAKIIEMRIGIFWWGSIICAGLATAAGFIAAAPEVKAMMSVQPWMISLLTAAAAGFQVVLQKTNWRAKSDAFYAHRDVLNQMARRYRYETFHFDEKLIKAISIEYREEDRIHGERLRKVNFDRDRNSTMLRTKQEQHGDTNDNQQ